MALAALVLTELDREGRLHREVISRLEAIDRADALRSSLIELGHAARIVALTDAAESRQQLDRLATEIDNTLSDLSERSAQQAGDARLRDEVMQSARMSLMHARSIPTVRKAGRKSADEMGREAERLAGEAAAKIERLVDTETAQMNRRSLAQIGIGEALRRYVVWALAGAVALLAALYALYGSARRRELAALARIEHMAHFDTVTNLPNRALLADRLEQEVSRAHRNERPFAVALFDLDGFKGVNDTWGHGVGDRALLMAAERARAAVRASDTVGRLGGDEFLAILPETTQDGALRVAEKLRDALAQPYGLGDQVANMSASVGVALFPAHGVDAEALQRAADEALYEAKREGKNRVKLAARRAVSPKARAQAAG